MAVSTIHMDKPLAVNESDIEVTPAEGYTWTITTAIEIKRNIYYLHLNIRGDFPATSTLILGNMKIKGKTPQPNQLTTGIVVGGGVRTSAVGQWLSSGDVRVFNTWSTSLTDQTAFLDGIVVLQD